MTKQKIIVSMIVKNEEAMLSRCLDSIKGVDDIYISDTGSTDKTIEIAKKYTKHVFTDYTWKDDFADARNHCLDKCPEGVWILTIDADEYLEPTGIDKIKQAISIAENKNERCIYINAISHNRSSQHKSNRLYKNDKDIRWKSSIHNYLSINTGYTADINLYYDHSPAHKNDPDRAFRMLQREVMKDPNGQTRNLYYLAREYYYKKHYDSSIYWLQMYVKKASWGPEWAEAYLLLAKSLWQMHRGEEARDACLMAIKINADFKDAILFMAEISSTKNKARWIEFASTAKNTNTLFSTPEKEQGQEYYNKLFENNSDMSRYFEIYRYIGEVLLKDNVDNVLDIGCGTGRLASFIKGNYHGIDFSNTAIDVAKKFFVHYKKKTFQVADIYSYDASYPVVISSEVLEHIDDLKVVKKLKSGSRFIFTVPNFTDPSHLRTYNFEVITERFGPYLNISSIACFDFEDGKWMLSEHTIDPSSKPRIYCIDSVVK